MNPLSEKNSLDHSSFIRLNSNFDVVYLSEKISDLLDDFFENHTFSSRENLPHEILDWVDSVQRKNDARGIVGEFHATTTFRRRARVLVVILSSDLGKNQYSLFVDEDERALEEYQDLHRQLTRRQLEMYFHYADGERDIGTIARKMGISVRTAEGHKMNLRRIVTDIV